MHDFQEKARFKISVKMKESALQESFETVPPASEMIVFLKQHLGVEAIPLVEVGETVQYGQKIARGDLKEPCACIHSPVNGRITAIKSLPHPSTKKPTKAFVIHTENAQTQPALTPLNWEETSKEKLLERIQTAGIVGLGGAAFPSHIKLNPPKPVDCLIINAKESDPNVACDFRLMIENPQAIVQGIQIMRKILATNKVIFATRTVEGETPELDDLLEQHNITISRITPCYSLGSEKLLIKELLDKEIPKGQYPFNVGVVVHNLTTAYAVWDAISNGNPLVSRGLTFYSKEKGGKNLWVRMGTPIAHILKHLDLSPNNFDRIVLGSILMGQTISSSATPTLKATSAITAFTTNEQDDYANSLLCIRCNYCNLVCPVEIYPQMIMEATKKHDKKWLQRLHVEICIDCGLCSYVCPSRINFTEFLKEGKKIIQT